MSFRPLSHWMFLMLGVGGAHAANLASFAQPDMLSGSGQNLTWTSEPNQSLPVGGLSVSALTGIKTTSSSDIFMVRDAFGAGLWITGSSPSGAGSAGGSYWIGGNTQNWGVVTPSSGSHYYQFSLTPDSGYGLSLNSLSFDWQAAINNSATTASFTYRLFSSTDGGASFSAVGAQGSKSVGNALGASLTDWGTITNEVVDLTGVAAGAGVILRLAVGTDTNTTSGSFAQFFQNIRIDGTVSAVPEPAAYGFSASFLLASVAMVRRRRVARRA